MVEYEVWRWRIKVEELWVMDEGCIDLFLVYF
jgi:hypothetical protein